MSQPLWLSGHNGIWWQWLFSGVGTSILSTPRGWHGGVGMSTAPAPSPFCVQHSSPRSPRGLSLGSGRWLLSPGTVAPSGERTGARSGGRQHKEPRQGGCKARRWGGGSCTRAPGGAAAPAPRPFVPARIPHPASRMPHSASRIPHPAAGTFLSSRRMCTACSRLCSRMVAWISRSHPTLRT